MPEAHHKTLVRAHIGSLSVDEIFNVFPDLIFVLDKHAQILEYRAGNMNDLYIPPDEFLGKSMCDVLPTEAARIIRQALDDSMRSQTVEVVEYKLPVMEAVKCFEARICLSDDERFIMLVRDITESKIKEEEITYQATHDHLTGLYNRAFAFDYINQKLKEAERQQFPVAILFIDIDEFKQVNDNFGHDVGDQVLNMTAKAIKVSLRDEDMVSRIGGDEFLVMITDKNSLFNLDKIVTKIQDSIEKFTHLLHEELSVSASIGYAICQNGKTSLVELIKQADLNMYKCKKN